MTSLKKLMLTLVVAVMGAVALSSCSDNDEEGKLIPPVTLNITAADITDVSASVNGHSVRHGPLLRHHLPHLLC